MLRLLKHIRGVGLLRDADGSALELRPLSLVYGENAAGKSTLSAVMRSLSTGEATIVTERQTFNFAENQHIDILDSDGVSYTFEDGRWSRIQPNVLVFDSSFVERNVYSGVTIQTDHRKSLLEFAIGSEAVSEKKAEAVAALLATSIKKEVRDIEEQIASYRADMPLEAFIGLPLFEDPEAELVELEHKLDQYKRVETLKTRKRPEKLTKPNLNLRDIAKALSASLDDVHETAAHEVRAHIEQLQNHLAESWISTGLDLIRGDECPFCGQSINANDLIAAYQAYFDDAYRRLKGNVAELPTLIGRLTREANADTLLKDIEAKMSAIAPWREDIELPAMTIDEQKLRRAIDELKKGVDEFSSEKADEPTVAIDSDRLAVAQGHIDVVMAEIEAVNGVLEDARKRVDGFLQGLVSLDREVIERDIRERRLAAIRHTEEVQDLCTRLGNATGAAREAEDKKQESRDRARARLNQVLDAYCEEINRLLLRFNASFQVTKLKHDYRTHGDPAINYALSVRSEIIEISQSERLLRAVLSDGDKRTLAFAFFLARLEQEASLATKILVLDDPMTSLDKNRQRSTIEVIYDLHQRVRQVIVLAHDPYFLLNLRDWSRSRDADVVAREIRIDFDGDDSVTFKPASLDSICRSQYARDYRTVDEYLAGSSEKLQANRALRPLLEGYLRRRFPLQFDGFRLHQMVQKIESAGADCPLAAASSEVNHLKALNVYSRSVHHGDNPDYGSDVELSDAELRSDCRAVLGIIHGWGTSR